MKLIDWHIHLGGSITPEFVWDTINELNLTDIWTSYNDVVSAMQYQHGEPPNFHRFLDKFRILDDIPWTEEFIVKSIASVSKTIIDNDIDYVLLRFSVNKYLPHIKLSIQQLVKLIKESFDQFCPGRVGLVLSLKYESARGHQRKMAKIIDDPDVVDDVMGLDLVGDETYFNIDFYKPIFKDWAYAQKIVFAHVGESQSVENVKAAIDAGITEIAHGIKAVEDRELLQKSKDLDVCYHMAPTSNFMTGVWTNRMYHPAIILLNNNVQVTIGTDDPVQCGTTLTKEYESLQNMGATDKDIETLQMNAITRLAKYGIIIDQI